MNRASSNSRGLYFVGPVVDTSVLGGVSIAAFAVLYWASSRIEMTTIHAASAALLVVVNHPHFSATVYRLYHSRANIAQYPLTAILVPFVILGGVWGSFASPEVVAPLFIKLYLIWSPYHFSGQSFGISMVYARRAGIRFSERERFVLSGFIYGTFILPLVWYETGIGRGQYYGVAYPTLGLPEWVRGVAMAWLVACGLAFAAMMLRRRSRGEPMPPAIVFLPAVTQFVWFVPGSRLPAFNEFVPMFHSLQYLFIAWALQLKERLDLESIAPSRRYVTWESVRWLLLNVVGGLLLFDTLPMVFELSGAPSAFVTGVIFAAVQLHHFFVDGVIWKLKTNTVSSPLMVNVHELAGAT